MDEDQQADEENAAGMTLVRAGRIADAIPHFERAAALVPDDQLLANNLSAALVECGRHEQALAVLDGLLAQDPGYAEAHHNRSVALRGLGRLAESIDSAKEAIRLKPAYSDALTNLAVSLAAKGEKEEARAACRRALAADPRSAAALMTLGTIVAADGLADRALELFGRAISVKPDLSAAYMHAGLLLRRLGRIDEAIYCFQQAANAPDATAEAYVRLGDTYALKRERRNAIECYGKALDLDPGLGFARAQRLHLFAWTCEWERIEEERHLIAELGLATDPVSPFSLLGLEDSPERHLVRSRRFSERAFAKLEPLPAVPAVAKDRLRLGYFSSDLHGHATAYLAARLFELHNRSQFEVHAFSYGPSAAGEMRARLMKAFDGFHEVTAVGDEEVALRAREIGIDIAIDLKGYTEGSRLGILAYRPAPVQITFLGYPGTTGAAFIDYLVVDPQVIPRSERPNYDEKLIVLPHCYQPTDNRRSIRNDLSRRDAGLPDGAFVFASFNHSWKIGRQEVDCWGGLLREVAGSVLWLLSSDPDAERNLRRELEQRGVESNRVIFAPFEAHDRHLGRLRHADLVLDTFTYGAHTTASDALWAGVPLVTCAGRGFATRVAASILLAAGLPELTTASPDEYCALALALAKDPKLLGELRERLAATRSTAPLFDSEGYTRAFEQGLREAYRRAVAGVAATDIIIH